jgi:hypothetical protein
MNSFFVATVHIRFIALLMTSLSQGFGLVTYLQRNAEDV